MDQNNFFKENNSTESIDQLILELKKNNDQSALHSQLLTIIKDLIVKQGYNIRKKGFIKPFKK